MNKKYIIEVAANKASLQKLKDDLKLATTMQEGVDAPELTRESKAKIKKDLAALFGVADYQAEALRNMVQAMTEGLADAKSVEAMKNQLKETLEFTTGIMKNMQQMGNATDWMKQGVTFADDFVNMQGSLEKTVPLVTGLKQSVGSLTKSFEKFKDALAETNADAFLQRFGNSTRSEAESLARAQKELQRIAKTRSWSLSSAISSGRSETPDFSGKNQEQIEAEYKKTIENIEKYNQKIDQLRQQFKGRTAELYKNNDYINAIKQLSKDMHYLNNMPSHFDGLDGNLKVTLKEATDSVKAASNEIKNIIKGAQGDGIELALTLPEASSAKFVGKINDFVSEASAEFKKKPIEISLDITTPLKNDAYDKNGELKKLTTKQQELSDKVAAEFKKATESASVEVGDEDLTGLYHKNVNQMVRNVIDAFTQMHKAMTTGQKLLNKSAESWRKDMSEAFTVKPKFNTEETKQKIQDAIADLQNAFDMSDEDNSNFWIVAKPDTRNFIQDIQNAIKDQSVTVDVKAGNIDGSDAVINIGDATMAYGGFHQIIDVPPQTQQESSAPRPISNLPSEQTPAINTNSVVVAENTRAQNVLSEAIRRLDFEMAVNDKRIELIDASEDNKSSDEVLAHIDESLEAMTRTREKLVEEKENIKQQREVETDSSKYDKLVKREREIEEVLSTQWKQYIALEAKRRNVEYKQSQRDDNSDDNSKNTTRNKYEKENKQLQKYKDSITSIMQSGENPTQLVVKELKQFWTGVKNEIQKASDNGDIAAENRWKAKAASMIAKGLDITKLGPDGMMDLIDDDEAIKIVESVLKRNKSLAGNLIEDDVLKTSAYVKRMAYYIPEVQKTMGVTPQSTLEATHELNLNENFKAALKLNEYIKKARDLLKIKDMDVDPSSIQKFIDYFRYFPEMASSIEYAQKYLTEMQGISNEPWNDKEQKSYQIQLAEIWDTLDTKYKQQFLDALNGTEAASGKNITWIKDFRDDASYDIARNAYFNTKEFQGLESLLSTDNPQLQQILDILRRSSLLNQIKISSKMFDDGNGVLSSLYGLQRYSGTMHATVVGRSGQERVLELNGGKTTTESDKRYTYAPRSFQRFIHNSGVETEINDLVEAMFDPTILLRDRLEAEVKQLEAEIANLKIGHFSANAFDGTPLEKSWREQKSKLIPISSLKAYLMGETTNADDEYLYHNFKNIRQEKNKESLIRKMKNQGYIPDYLQEKIKDLTDSEKESAIQNEIKILERDLANLKSHNKEFAASKLSELKSEIMSLVRDNQQAILELIKARNQELEAKREELKAAEVAAMPAERNVEAKSEVLFGSGKFRLSANATQAEPLWAQEEGFSKTPLGRYQKKLEQNQPQQERLLAEIKDIDNGIYSDAVTKRLVGLSEDTKQLEIQKIIAEKKALYDRLNVALPTKEEIFQSLLVRDKDIQIAKARAQKEASKSNKRERLAERVASGDDKSAYRRATNTQRNAVEQSDYHLEGLLSRIGLAGQTGLMDTSELKELAENYKQKLAATLELPTRGAYITTRDSASNAAQRELNQLEDEAYKAWENYENAKQALQEANDKFNRGEITEQDLQSSGLAEKLDDAKMAYEKMRNKIYAIGSDANAIEPGTIEEFGNAYEELFEARKALLDKFFGTKGWNVVRALEDKLSAIDGELAEEERKIRSNAGSKNDAINSQIASIQASEASAKASADRYTDGLIKKYIIEPQSDVERAERSHAEEAEGIKSNAKAQKDALRLRVVDGKYLSSQISAIETERGNDFRLKHIAEQKKKVGNINAALRLIDGQLLSIANRYYENEEIASLLTQRNQMQQNGQTKDPKYKEILAKIKEKSASYVDEVNKVIAMAINSATDDVRPYLEQIKAELGNKAPVKNPFIATVLKKQRDDLQLSLNGSEIVEAEINASYDTRIAAIRQLQESDKIIHSHISEITDRWQKEVDPIEQEMRTLRSQPGGLQSDGYKVLIAKREQINIKYNKEIQEAQNQWFKEQEAILDQQEADLLASLTEGTGVDTKEKLKEFNKMASEKLGRKVSVRSQSGIERIIQEIKEKAYAEAEAATTQALAQVDKSAEVSPAEIERQVAVERAKAEEKKKKAIEEFSKKSDSEVMAMHYETASQNLDKSAEASREHAKQLKAEQEADMARYGITQEMIETANLNVDAANELTEARNRENNAVKPTSTPTSEESATRKPFGGLITPGLVGAFNTSDLAKESTLRGIYELLNGGAPKGGWGNNDSGSIFPSVVDDDFSDGQGNSMSALASGIKDIIADTKNYSVEVGYLVDRFGKLGETIKGKTHSVPHDAFMTEVNKHTDKNILAALHSHPGKTSQHLSPGDIYSSYNRAYFDENKIPISGSINEGIISAIDWREIDVATANLIVKHYRDLMNNWQSTLPDVFTYNESTQRYDANSDVIMADAELQKTISKKYNEILQQALSDFGYTDRYMKFDDAEKFASHILGSAVSQVAEQIIKAGAQAAEESVNSENFTKEQITAKQTAFQEKFKTKELKNGKKGFDIKGASKVDQALYNVGNLLTKASSDLTNNDLKKLETAYSQLTNGLQEDIVQHLDKDTIEFLNILKSQISSVLGTNSTRLADKAQKSGSIKAAKDYLSKLKTEDGKKVTGASRASTGIDWISEILGKDSVNLEDADLKQLALGYHKLQETVNSSIFNALDENTKKVINDAIQEAKVVLDKYNVTMQGKELVGTVLDASNKDLFDNAAKDGTRKAGKTIKSVSEPQIMRDGKVISKASVYLGKTSKKNKKDTSGQENTDHSVTEELQQQTRLSAEVAKNEAIAADSAMQHASAEAVVTQEMNNQRQTGEKTKLTKESVDTAKSYLDTLTRTKQSGEVVKQTGVNRAKGGLTNVYSVLSKNGTKLTDENLNKLKTGYKQLVETIEHAIFNKLDEQTQQLLVQAKNEALDVLNKNSIRVDASGNLNGVDAGISSGSGGDSSGGSSTIKVPESGNNQGGILGLLSQIAKEETLNSILAQLSKGIKTTSSGENASGGKGNKKEETEAKTVLNSDQMRAKLLKEARKLYPERTSKNIRSAQNGKAMSMDVWMPYSSEERQKEIAKTQEKLNQLTEQGLVNTNEWILAEQKLNALKTEQEKITIRINEAGDITTKSSFENFAVGTNAAYKELQNVEQIMQQIHATGTLSFDDNGTLSSSNATINKLLANVQELNNYQNQLSEDKLFSSESEQQLSNYALKIQNARKEVVALLEETYKLNNGEKLNTNIDTLPGGIAGRSDGDIKRTMQELVAQNSQAVASFGELKRITNEYGAVTSYQLNYTLRTGKREVQEMTASLNPLTNELRVQKGTVKEVATGWDKFVSGLRGKFSSIIQYLVSITSIHDFIRYFRQGIQYVREIDSALTELKKVTNETDASYAKFLNTMSQTASEVGGTIANLTTMAAEWARLGYTMEEAGKLAQSTAILLNVSEFQDATTASEALISTMQAFQYTADESQHVVDVLNEVGNNYAISSDGIATALQDSASALMEAGNNLEQAVALVAAANKVVQDPNSVGSALRTISLRLRGTSIKTLEGMGEDVDGFVGSVSKMQTKIKALTGVDILTDSGAYKDTYTILKEIGTVWEDMSDIDQAALLELMAGKNRANTLAAILGNMEDLEGAYSDALYAEGSALRENEKYLDSIQGRIDLFNNSMQTLWNNMINSEVVKTFVSFGTKAIDFLDTSYGKVIALVAALKIMAKFKGTDFDKWFTPKKSTSDNESLLKSKVQAARQAYMNDPTNPAKREAYNQSIEGLKQYQEELRNVDEAQQNIGDSAEQAGKKANSGFVKAANGAKKLGKEIWITVKQIATMYAVATILDLIGKGFAALSNKIKDNSNSFDVLNEKYKELSDQLENCESDIKSLESELETTNEQIEELMDQGTLSFVEKEELQRLKDTTAELERQIAMKKTLQSSLQSGTNSAAIRATDAYLNQSFNSEKSKTERQEEAEESGKTAGQIVGLILGVIAAIGITFATSGAGTPAAAAILSAAGAGGGIGSAIGGATGGAIGAASAGYAYDQEQTTKEAIAEMNKTRDELIKARDEAYRAYMSAPEDDEKLSAYLSAYEDTAETLSKYDEKMANVMTTMAQSYNMIMSNWDGADEKQQEKAREYGDILDKYNIKMNGINAKQNAIDRIFGTEADAKIKSVKSALEEMASTGSQIDLKKAFGDDTAAYDAFVDRLYDMGIYVHELEDAFVKMHEEEVKAAEVDFTGVAKDIKGVADAIQGLKNALDEFLNNGSASTDTILGMEDFFDTDELKKQYDAYVGVMLSGEASIEEAMEATRNLAQAYLEDKINPGNLTDAQKSVYTNLLKKLGIKNAEEFIKHELQNTGIQKLQSLIDNNVVSLSNWANDERVQEIIKAYELETDVVSDLIQKLQEKNALETKTTEHKQSLKDYDEFVNKYKVLQQDKQQIDKMMESDGVKEYQKELRLAAISPDFNPDDWSLELVGQYGSTMKHKSDPNRTMAPTTHARLKALYDEHVRPWIEAKAANELAMANLIEDARPKGWLNEDGSIRQGVRQSLEEGVKTAQAEVDKVDTEIDAEFTIQYDLEFYGESVINTISGLTAAVEEYKAAVAAADEVLFDGQVISEDYYNTLSTYLQGITVDTESFSDAIDTNNGYVVKNASLLKALIKQSRLAQKATVQVAKAQAQLQYRELVLQMSSSQAIFNNVAYDNISTMREQLDVLKQTIQQYSLLELGLSDAANAYTQYQNAQERDSKLTYDDSFLDMLQTIDQGILKNETGTEAFEYAVKALIPEEYWNIDDVDKKIKSIHDYIDGNEIFSKLYHVDNESGELSINADNVRALVDMGRKKGVFEGDDATDFSLSKNIDGIEDVAEAYGITEAAALAFLSALEKVDAKWGNILTDVTTKPLERDVNNAVDGVSDATKAMEDFWSSAYKTGNYDATELEKLQQNLDHAKTKFNEAETAANNNASSYMAYRTVLSAAGGDIKLSKEQVDELAKSLELVDENGEPTISVTNDGTLIIAEDDIDYLLSQIAKLEEPATIRIQLLYDKISSEIDTLQKYIEDKCTEPITIDGVEIKGEEEAQAKLNELLPQQKTIEAVYQITTTTSEAAEGDKSVLESYQELAKNGLKFAVTADVTDPDAKIDGIYKKIVDDSFIITAEDRATGIIDSIATHLESLKDKEIEIKVTEKRSVWTEFKSWLTGESNNSNSESGMVGALGNAMATGNVGLRSDEHDAVVGELGPEMVVDPIKGVYYTVGDNGTEMVDLPKGAIIYNHKQTEELLKNGHTTRGHYTGGLSFAQGNAHGTNGIPSYHPNTKDSTSLKNGTGINNKWDDTASTLGDAANSVSDAADEFREVFDWIEVRLEEINEKISLSGAELENKTGYADKNEVVDKIIALNQKLYDNLLAGSNKYYEYARHLLGKVPSAYRDAAQDGTIAIEEFVGKVDEKTLEAIQEYREWVQKGADLTQQAEETLTEIRSLYVQKIDNAEHSGSVKATIEDSQTEKLQNAVDFDEERGLITDPNYYAAMMENSERTIAYLTTARNEMQKAFDKAVKDGQLIAGSDEWYENLDKLYQMDAEIDEATIELEEFQNAINDIYWESFDELINRFDYISDETQGLIDLMSELDMVSKPDNDKGWGADDVEWTKEGLASLGLHAQEMERAEAKAKMYAKAIDDLTAEYKAGHYSESEYYEKLNELTQGQYDAIEAAQDEKEAIKELNEQRVDAVKEGIELQIKAYEELIEKKKEELDAEKDLYDFQKSTMEQQKSIAEINRKIAALSGDTSASATAKRKQLEAELAEARADLDESYYDRSVENQQNALDKELENFQKEKEEEIEQLEKWLENVEQVVTESLGIVQANAAEIGATLTEKTEEYSLTVSSAVLSPWQDGAIAIDEYTTRFGDAVSSTTEQLETIRAKWQEVREELEAANIEADKYYKAGTTDGPSVAEINKENANYVAAKKVETSTSNKGNNNTNKPSTSTQKSITVGGKINAGGAKIYSYVGDTSGARQYYSSDPIYTVLEEKSGYLRVRHHKSSHGTTGWFKKSDVKAYSKGSMGVDEDQWALLHELGDELTLAAGPNGKLQYITKGTTVIPHDISENLVQLGQLDPSEVLNRNKPQITPSKSIVNNNMEINVDASVGTLIHVDRLDGNNPDEVIKLVDKAWDKKMQGLNNAIKKFSR